MTPLAPGGLLLSGLIKKTDVPPDQPGRLPCLLIYRDRLCLLTGCGRREVFAANSPGCQGTPGFQFTICRSDWNISVPVIFSLQILKCIAWPFGAIVIGDGLGMLQMYRHSGDKWSYRSRETYRRRWSRAGRRSGLDAWSCPSTSTADRDIACP